FGELEFWFSIIKVVTIITMVIVGLVLIFLSFKTEYGHASFGNFDTSWRDVSTWCSWIFNVLPNCCIFIYRYRTYRSHKLDETKNPRKTIPKAINNVPIRILLFYIGGLLVIMSVIPWFKVDPDSSPFVNYSH
ncbi:gamma-aminobutyrate permease, partial [Klebsiella pneumoniae]